MALDVGNVAVVAEQVLASDSYDIRDLGLVFLLSGVVFYGLVYRYYRNADKRYRYETQTEATVENMRREDKYKKTRRKLSSSRMQGANNRSIRGAQVHPDGLDQQLKKTMRKLRR